VECEWLIKTEKSRSLEYAPAVGTDTAVNSRDFGTSHWQLVIEPYTHFPCVRQFFSIKGQQNARVDKSARLPQQRREARPPQQQNVQCTFSFIYVYGGRPNEPQQT
jgi:hypothetical protein